MSRIIIMTDIIKRKTPELRNTVGCIFLHKSYLMLFHILLARVFSSLLKYSITTSRFVVSAVGYCAKSWRVVCSGEVINR